MISFPRLRLAWQKILDWIGVNWINEELCHNHLVLWLERFKGRRSKKRKCVIWLEVGWCIWWSRMRSHSTMNGGFGSYRAEN